MFAKGQSCICLLYFTVPIRDAHQESGIPGIFPTYFRESGIPDSRTLSLENREIPANYLLLKNIFCSENRKVILNRFPLGHKLRRQNKQEKA